MKGFFIKISTLYKATSVNNFVNLSLNQGINVAVALLVTPILYQRLGEEQFGLVSLSLSIALTLGIVVNYGFNVNGPKRIALMLEDPKQQSELINQIVTTRLLLSLSIVVIVLFCIYVLGFFQGYSAILALSLIVLAGEAVFPMFILQGFDRLLLIAVSNGIIKVAYLVGILLIVDSVDDAQWVNFVFGSITFVVNISLLSLIYDRYTLRFKWARLTQVVDRLKDNFQFFSYSLATHIMINGGFLLLNSFVSEVELGKYSVAQRVGMLLRAIPAFLAQSILQKAARLYHGDKSGFKTYLRRTFVGGLVVTLMIGVIMTVFADWVVGVVAGEYIDYSADVLKLLSFVPFLAMLNIDNMVKIIVNERKQVLSRAIWSTTLLMFPIAILAIRFYGGMGLAVALLVTELVNFVIHKVLLNQSIRKENEN